jgi:hypothetical protein
MRKELSGEHDGHEDPTWKLAAVKRAIDRDIQKNAHESELVEIHY